MSEKKEMNQEKEIDLLHLLNVVLNNIVIILIVTVAAAMIALVYAKFIVSPSYQSSALMYVNNKNDSSSGYISSTEITAAKSLVSTYSVIMKTNRTLEKVIDYTGVDYTPAELKKMINAVSVDNTEIFKITVTSPDPDDAKLIAEGIIKVLPDAITAVIAGARVAPVDDPTNGVKSAPSVSKTVLIGAVIGFFFMSALIIIFDLIDDKIHDEKYITENYSIPVLAVIPNIYIKQQGGNYHEKT